MANPGAFGRRLTRRREELGLSLEDLSKRTGTAVPYLRHLETSPVAMPDARAILKLAAGLETTSAYLFGTEMDRPSGAGGAGESPSTSEISEDECWRLIGPGGVARLVFDSERGPTALPVNFRTVDRAIVFRTESGSHFDHLDGQEPVGLEIDQLDEASSSGWSVLLTGRVRRPTDEAELEKLRDVGVSPWPGGGDDHYLVLEAQEITGRGIDVER
jgi:hypothetical protein